MPQVFRRPFRLISGGVMRSLSRQLSDQTSTQIALMNSVQLRMASGPKPYRYLRAYVVVLVVIELLTRLALRSAQFVWRAVRHMERCLALHFMCTCAAACRYLVRLLLGSQPVLACFWRHLKDKSDRRTWLRSFNFIYFCVVEVSPPSSRGVFKV